MLLVWKQKHQSQHGTCDKTIFTPPSRRMCPLFGELKKRKFFYPPPPVWTKCLLSIFFGGIPQVHPKCHVSLVGSISCYVSQVWSTPSPSSIKKSSLIHPNYQAMSSKLGLSPFISHVSQAGFCIHLPCQSSVKLGPSPAMQVNQSLSPVKFGLYQVCKYSMKIQFQEFT